jgi:monoterpene epsilon-lactone hydrolase
MTDDTRSTRHVPGRDIPVPAHLSPEAQAMLSLPPLGEAPPSPALDDKDGWRARTAAQNEMVLAAMAPRAATIDADVEDREIAGVPVYVITPRGITADDSRVFLDIHGGALVMGNGECCRAMGLTSIPRTGVTTWAVDYRMPPDDPYPAPLDDCVAVYRALLDDHDPRDVIVGGSSAGGNLAAALILRARDEGLPLPAAAVLLTPEVDLTESGDSFRTNLGLDSVLTASLMETNLLYADGHDLAHPYLSPLFGDFTKGFPPTFLQAGTRDLFLSNAVRMHRALRAAGIPAELHVFEAAPHGLFFGTAPEDHELDREARRFVDEHWLA